MSFENQCQNPAFPNPTMNRRDRATPGLHTPGSYLVIDPDELWSPTYHRYKPVDLLHVDPLCGGDDAFDALLRTPMPEGCG